MESGNTMNDMQRKLLEIIKWYHNFCVKNGLRYYLIGGSMLGAIRHKGFIPWDDDIDVGMPRKDFERFLSLTEGKIIDHYTSESFHSKNPDYVYPFAKLYDTETTLTEMKRIPVTRGVYIDVFPLDGASFDKRYQKSYKKFRYWKNLLSILTADVNENRNWKVNWSIRLARLIPFHITITKRLLYLIDHFCQTIDFDNAATVANLVGSRKSKELLDWDIFGTPVLYDFEDTKLYGVQLYDRYLSELIGDWKVLPPEDKRYGHFNGYCDLKNGYIKNS